MNIKVIMKKKKSCVKYITAEMYDFFLNKHVNINEQYKKLKKSMRGKTKD